MYNLINIQENLKIFKYRNFDFFFEFLYKFNFPKSTIDKLKINNQKTNALKVDKKIIFLYEKDKQNLSNILEECKSNFKNKYRFILIFNGSDIISYDYDVSETLFTDINNLNKEIQFFLPLLGIKKNHDTDFLDPNVQSSKKLATLYNELIIFNKFKEKNEKFNLNNFFNELILLFILDSFKITKKFNLNNHLKIYLSNKNHDSSVIINDIFQTINGLKKKIPDYLGDISSIKSNIFNKETLIPKFNKTSLKLLIELSKINWLALNPSLISSIIDNIVFSNEESSFGYLTAESNILKVLNPLFIEDINNSFDKNFNDSDELKKLLIRICNIKIVDPSCGSGNFLVVAYLQLKSLELKLKKRIIDLNVSIPNLEIKINNFIGIENNFFISNTAKISVFVAYLQKINKQTTSKKEIIKFLNNYNKIIIINSNPLLLNWKKYLKESEEIYILGAVNSKGSRKMNPNEKKLVDNLYKGINNYKDLDYACAYIYKACEILNFYKNLKISFVTTNSITQGQQVSGFWKILKKYKTSIFFCYPSFKWKSIFFSNTALTVIIIGLGKTKASNLSYRIYDQLTYKNVDAIGPYLTENQLVIEGRSNQISKLPKMIKGNMPYDDGHLLLSSKEKNDLIEKYPTSEKFIKKIVGSDEFINSIERYCIWIEKDDLKKALLIKPIKERILKVKKYRENKEDSSAKKLANAPYRFREQFQTTTNSIIIPSVSSEKRRYLPIGFINNKTIITNLAFAIYNCEVWMFGILISRMHYTWIKNVIGRLETRIRYSNKIGYNTFPCPKLNLKHKLELKKFSLNILSERQKYTELTLGRMYNDSVIPSSLAKIHKDLDVYVDSIYDIKSHSTDHDRFKIMIKLYSKLIN